MILIVVFLLCLGLVYPLAFFTIFCIKRLSGSRQSLKDFFKDV